MCSQPRYFPLYFTASIQTFIIKCSKCMWNTTKNVRRKWPCEPIFAEFPKVSILILFEEWEMLQPEFSFLTNSCSHFFFFYQAQILEKRTNKFNSFFLPVLYPECPDMLAFLKERRWVTWMKEYKTGRWLRTVEKASDKIQCAYLLLHASHLGEALNIEMEQGIIWNNTVYFIPFPSERVLRIVLSIRTHHSKMLSLTDFGHACVDLIPVWHCCVDRST